MSGDDYLMNTLKRSASATNDLSFLLPINLDILQTPDIFESLSISKMHYVYLPNLLMSF